MSEVLLSWVIVMALGFVVVLAAEGFALFTVLAQEMSRVDKDWWKRW